MGSPLPRGPPCCSRLPKATPTQPTSQSLALFSQGRPGIAAHHPRRVVISAFLFNPAANGNSSRSSSNRSRESITNRLSELRIRSDEERALLSQQRAEREEEEEDDRRLAESSGRALADEAGPGPRVGRGMGPWPAATSDDEDGDQGMALAAASSDGPVTPRSLRYMITDPKPEIKLLHRFKSGQSSRDTDFWNSFVDKCRLAWGVFFPPAPHSVRRQSRLSKWAGGISRMLAPGPGQAAESGGAGAGGGDGAAVSGLSAKQVVLSRLQMVLIADRCGVSPEHLLEMKAQTLTALAEYMGKDLEEDVSQLEVQVSALKPNGERITMTIGFADMLGDEQLRDPIQYHYEFEDDDDYFLPEEDDGRVADIAEAPAAGLKAARVVAQPVAGGVSAGEAA
ncbi:hypothetical protein PLESTB_001397400 [Pleodorina starrii]|uniref:Uncharacterized protein n=1 Tax=Pleodorina starrii TaxID=330485 RepID=A0A9W6F7K8_9CHLO|nr:hypothetical protein PLESTM_000534900 [Pleodorina starrii]GLC58755.1 hypothetical protein PLESTB_001397400 [Pleodorina starrii]GLC75160.1 hypothetical protein PLESTF_001601700 [Pleodorina starrii]